MKVPNEIREKILLAGEYYEKAWSAECEVRGWLQKVGLASATEETPTEEAFIDYVRLGDGGSAKSFIELLESLEEADPIDWEGKEPLMICYFSVEENRDGETWVECQGRMSRMSDESDGAPAWQLAEFLHGERFLLGHSDLSWLEVEPECWDGDEERDRVDYLTNEEAAKYHASTCSGKFLFPAQAYFSTPCGWYYFTI